MDYGIVLQFTINLLSVNSQIFTVSAVSLQQIQVTAGQATTPQRNCHQTRGYT